MLKTNEFKAFYDLYHAILRDELLTLAEKTAAIEAAGDEFLTRAQPAAYRDIVRRLAALPPRESHGRLDTTGPHALPDGAAQAKAPATGVVQGTPADAGSSKGRLASRPRR